MPVSGQDFYFDDDVEEMRETIKRLYEELEEAKKEIVRLSSKITESPRVVISEVREFEYPEIRTNVPGLTVEYFQCPSYFNVRADGLTEEEQRKAMARFRLARIKANSGLKFVDWFRLDPNNFEEEN